MKALILVLLLSACASFDERPLKTGIETRLVSLERTYTATEDCSKTARAAPGWKIIACAYSGPDSCLIKMQPDASDDTLGHEARHCFDGSWHK